MAFTIGLLWAVLVAVVASFLLGFLWYGPIMGKPWMKAMGWNDRSPAELKAEQAKAMPGYAISIVAAIVTTVLLWILYGWAAPSAGYAGPALGMAIGLAGWVAFYVPGTLTTAFFESRSWTLTWISAGYWVIVALVQGAAVGFFA